jgi:uncharacterized protein with LGFP repeats
MTTPQQAIASKYASLGGSAGVLGAATTPFATDPTTKVSHITYVNGSIYYIATIGAHAMYGDIYKKWVASGGEAGFCRMAEVEHI